MKKFYYLNGVEKKGEFTLDELTKENINEETYIWFDGLEDWTKLSEIEELKDLLKPKVPPIPTIQSPPEIPLVDIKEETEKPVLNVDEDIEKPNISYERPVTYIKQPKFAKTFSFKGRIRRTEYGLSLIISIFIYFILSSFMDKIIYSGDDEIFWILLLAIIPLYWFLWAQGAKRCHDIGHSGWYQFIPFYVFWMIFSRGDTDTDNKYGARIHP